ncbi:MAG: 2-amino-4-hydroxy-6-hydroxymethyldihydropteridine diphosphokinase [Candidatus Thiodiazotropha sp. (ex Epidulcina cf. delphinae)]|nr:2-amino-4-hydroxy-6-hydroxymethyldihydropteridine diphosphokinase [Candidatus Thiodiazotropha sp. (ex Epidulcina cf. delphinae)]
MSEVRTVTAYVGLGSNLENPRRQVEVALRELAELRDSRLLSHSSLYRSRAIGLRNQPDFINAVASLSTRLDAHALLDALQAIEQVHRRRRDGERWGPRTLDLDLLVYGDGRIDTPRLRVPHPEMANRAFVLFPLSEIAPEGMEIPGIGPLRRLAQGLSGDGVERLR